MKILSLLLCFISINAFAQQYQEYQYDNKPKKDAQLDYTTESPEVNRTTPESTLLYLKSGFSVGTVNGLNSQFTPAALGTRRYADEFYYGAEYSTHFGAEKMKTSLVNVQFGHHFLTWRHRVKPYIGGSFGYATQSDTSDKKRPSGSGIGLGLDLGFQIYKIGPFTMNTGINLHQIKYNKPETQNSNFQDIYFMFGVAF